jgi:hypothetical protein
VFPRLADIIGRDPFPEFQGNSQCRLMIVEILAADDAELLVSQQHEYLALRLGLSLVSSLMQNRVPERLNIAVLVPPCQLLKCLAVIPNLLEFRKQFVPVFSRVSTPQDFDLVGLLDFSNGPITHPELHRDVVNVPQVFQCRDYGGFIEFCL